MLHAEKTSWKKTPSLVFWFLSIVIPIQMTIAGPSIKEDIEQYFTDQWQAFDKIAASSSIKKTSLSQVDRYFVASLKRNQTFYTFIKTNSKGVLINEVIRGEKPIRKFRDVGTQKWYYYVSRKYKDYQGFLRDENGRYYLFWAKPVLKMTRSGVKKYIGATAVKVDLWDCFHKFASDVDEPFLIRLGRKSLYSNKWKKGTEFEEKNLDIPGVKRVSVRYIKSTFQEMPTDRPAIAAVQDTGTKEISPEEKTLEVEEKTESKQKISPLKRFGKAKKIVFIIIVVAVIILILYLSKLITIYKDWRLRRKIEKEENLLR